jgi:hypothetical protein
MKRLLWFTGSTGLDMSIDSVRHVYDPEKGIAPAKVAYNVDFDRSGRVSRRKGWRFTDVQSSCHSLYSGGGNTLFVSGSALYVLAGDLTATPIRNVTSGARMYYEQVGSKTFYMNGAERGFVLEGVSYSWEYPDQAYGQKDSTKTYSPPPMGSILCYFRGRMYIVQNYVAWYSEAYNLFLYDLVRNFIGVESDITMFKGVERGIWIGTRNRVVFLRGTGPEDFSWEKKALFGVVPGTDVEVDAGKLADQRYTGVGVLFTSTEGVFYGSIDGHLMEISAKKLKLPGAVNGAGVVVNDKYIVSLEP